VAALTDLYSKAQALKKKKEREVPAYIILFPFPSPSSHRYYFQEIIKELRRWLEPYRVFPWGNLLLPINPDITVTGLIPGEPIHFLSLSIYS